MSYSLHTDDNDDNDDNDNNDNNDNGVFSCLTVNIGDDRNSQERKNEEKGKAKGRLLTKCAHNIVQQYNLLHTHALSHLFEVTTHRC